MATLWDDYVSISLARFDELEIHRLDRLGVSFDDPVNGLASFYDVTGHHPHEPVVIVSIHEQLDVELFAQFCASEDKYAFHDDYLGRSNTDGLVLRP